MCLFTSVTVRLPHPRLFGASLMALLAGTPVHATEPPRTMPVQGTVTLAGRPLSGAEVRIYGAVDPGPDLTVRTGTDGRFAVTAPSVGLWRVRVEARGALPAETWAEPFKDPVALPPVDLVPASALAVQIVDERGEPVTALVAASAKPDLGAGWWLPTEVIPTDEDGRARIFRAGARASADPWTLRVQADGFAPLLFELSSTDLAVQPGGVQPGGTPGLTLTLSRGIHRPVEILDARGGPVPGVAIYLRSGGAALPPLAVTDDRGRAALAAPSDTPVDLVLLAPDGSYAARALGPPPEGAGDTAAPEILRLPPGAELRGRTIQERTGRPVGGARVWLRPPAPPTRWLPYPALCAAGLLAVVRTDPQGRFRLPAPPWPVKLATVAPDHLPLERSLPDSQPNDLNAENRLLEMALTPLRFGSGQVTDLDDRAVTGAVVRLTPQASPASGDADRTERARTEMVRTDPEGRFGFANPRPGRHDLEVRAPGFAPVQVPGVEIPAAPGEIDLGAVVLAGGHRLAGRVVAPDGQPLEGAEVLLTATGTTPAAMEMVMSDQPVQATSDPEGRFRLEDLSPGLVHLRVRRTGYLPFTGEGLEIPSLEPLEVVLRPAGEVSGWVLDPEGQPVAGALVSVAEEIGEARAGEATPGNETPGNRRDAPANAGPREAGSSSAGFATTSDDGRFEIRNVTPGRLVLTATAGGYLETRKSGLELEPRGALRGLEVALQRGASVSGRVWDPQGLPVAGALVRAEPRGSAAPPAVRGTESSTRPLPAMIRTGPEGDFELVGLTPGPHALVAEDDLGRRARRELLVTDRHDGLDLTLEGGTEIAGRVRGPDGQPVPDTRMTLLNTAVDRQSLETRSDPSGSFAFHGVPAGSYRLLALGGGFVPTWYPQPLQVGAAPLRGLEVELEAGATVRGRVEGVDFEDLSRAVVRLPSVVGAFGRLDFEGRFELRGVPPGERTLEVALPGRSPVHWRLTVPPGASEVTVELRLGANVPSGDTP